MSERSTIGVLVRVHVLLAMAAPALASPLDPLPPPGPAPTCGPCCHGMSGCEEHIPVPPQEPIDLAAIQALRDRGDLAAYRQALVEANLVMPTQSNLDEIARIDASYAWVDVAWIAEDGPVNVACDAPNLTDEGRAAVVLAARRLEEGRFTGYLPLGTCVFGSQVVEVGKREEKKGKHE